MLKRYGAIGVLTIAFVAVATIAALAVEQTNGQGKTHDGASLGFNAQADLSGQLEYHVADNSFFFHCDGYYHYEDQTYKNPWPKTLVRSSTCLANDGKTYYIRAEFIDRGEPGTRDAVCILVSPDKHIRLNAFIRDCGIIQDGNVQIHTSQTPLSGVNVSTPDGASEVVARP